MAKAGKINVTKAYEKEQEKTVDETGKPFPAQKKKGQKPKNPQDQTFLCLRHGI